MVSRNDDEFRLVARHLSKDARRSNMRSSLFCWLLERADAFQNLLDDNQPSWKSTADALRLLDLRDGDGKLPTPVRVRKTWAEVKRVKAPKTRRASLGAPAAVAPLPLPIAINATPSQPALFDDDDGEFEFRTLTRR